MTTVVMMYMSISTHLKHCLILIYKQRKLIHLRSYLNQHGANRFRLVSALWSVLQYCTLQKYHTSEITQVSVSTLKHVSAKVDKRDSITNPRGSKRNKRSRWPITRAASLTYILYNRHTTARTRVDCITIRQSIYFLLK